MDRDEYNSAFKNGKKHIDLAKILAENKDYGTAITFLVLGLEELIKYLVIQTAVADKTLFTDKEINNIFSNHKEKHKMIIEFIQATKLEFGENFIMSVFKKMTNEPLTDELKTVQANRFKEFGTMIGVTERHLTNDEIDSFIKWLAISADKYKNKGLYVDRIDNFTDLANSKLISPADIEEKEFELVLKFADSFLRQATFSNDIDITDDELLEILNADIEQSDK